MNETTKDFDGFEIVEPDIEYWNPKKKGEFIEGIFTKEYDGRRHKRFVVTDTNEKEWIMPDSQYIRKVFGENLRVGMGVKVRYDGMSVSNVGNNIYYYTIGVKVPGGVEDEQEETKEES